MTVEIVSFVSYIDEHEYATSDVSDLVQKSRCVNITSCRKTCFILLVPKVMRLKQAKFQH